MLIIELCICTLVAQSSPCPAVLLPSHPVVQHYICPVVQLSGCPVVQLYSCPGVQSVPASSVSSLSSLSKRQVVQCVQTGQLGNWTDWTTGQPDDLQIYNWTTVQFGWWRTSHSPYLKHSKIILYHYSIIYSLKSGVIILKPSPFIMPLLLNLAFGHSKAAIRFSFFINLCTNFYFGRQPAIRLHSRVP